MKNKSDFFLRIALIVGDAVALILSFAMAYFVRVHVDPRPFVFESQLLDFTMTVALVVPVMLVIIAALGLYKKSIFMGRARLPERVRLVLAAVLSVAALIVYDFFVGENLFPVRVMALLAVVFSFVFLLLERIGVRFVVRQIFKSHYGAKRAIIIGNSKNTGYLADYLASTPESGYRLVGVVAGRRFIPKDLKTRQYSSLKDALKKAQADVVFQTDEKSTEYVYKQTVKRHLEYYFVPSETALSSHFGELELVGNIPAVMVMATPLSGGYAVFKRAFDIVFALIAIILTAIPMILVWLILKISDFRNSPIYADERLTQYNRKFRCYKFRSMKPEYSGMPAEKAFCLMGKPELIKKYRQDGDYLKMTLELQR